MKQIHLTKADIDEADRVGCAAEPDFTPGFEQLDYVKQALHNNITPHFALYTPAVRTHLGIGDDEPRELVVVEEPEPLDLSEPDDIAASWPQELARLRRENEKAEASFKWRSPEERPNEGQVVLILRREKTYDTQKRVYAGEYFTDSNGGGISYGPCGVGIAWSDVIEWMPCPMPTKEYTK